VTVMVVVPAGLAVVEAAPADQMAEVADLEDPAVPVGPVVDLVDLEDPAVLVDQVVVAVLPAETLLPVTPAEEEEAVTIQTRIGLRSHQALLHPHHHPHRAHLRARRRPRPLRGPLRRQRRRSHLQLPRR